ncbi:DNA oxidative demethylase AlkB [Agrobacterium bohemicum]|uniref:Alpha-ketoglutarate-dependent dioxygenase AlkB n=1 Tax=Agrobacterium bohemicum TaxID=2052828 RepID=A0A135P153_9HYPH|nr:DNA oxidative demethylase AlkB [Agrobacterium bohemicum]KXG85116.1 alpha-ketoglutarate-dependent dioxygenase AlkB [Agrobacterium bohemicum]
MDDLFSGLDKAEEEMAEGAWLLRRYAFDNAGDLLAQIEGISATAPFRHMVTPGGFSMSVGMTNCGPFGWVTDRKGYRYQKTDPESGQPWPAMPETFLSLAIDAAKDAGYADFVPNACLINRYEPGAKMSLHQDKDERDFTNPIVSVSLGLPATFQFGGINRGDPVRKYPLSHGDVVVWGGPSRLFYHGIMPLKEGTHDAAGRARFNLTFRHAAL